MDELREQIDECDDQIMTALDQRLKVVRQVADYKKNHNMPVKQTDRMDQLVKRLIDKFGDENLTDDFIAHLYRVIMEHAISLENETLN